MALVCRRGMKQCVQLELHSGGRVRWMSEFVAWSPIESSRPAKSTG